MRMEHYFLDKLGEGVNMGYIKMNFKELQNISDKRLLQLANKLYEMEQNGGFVDEYSIHYVVNEVSRRHYGIDDVLEMEVTDEQLCFDKNGFVKIVKEPTAKKWLKNLNDVGAIMRISTLWSVDSVDGNIYFH